MECLISLNKYIGVNLSSNKPSIHRIMFIIIGIMLTGMLIGYLLRSKRLHRMPKVITVLIWLLLFLLGIDVGNNDSIIRGLHTIGVEAFLITIGAVAGSTLFAWALWHFVSNKKSDRA